MTTPTGAAGLGAAPVVARWGTGHPSAPLVVTLHGGGASEASMIELAPWLPPGPVAYAAVRGPIEDGSGFRWFVDGAGLATTMRWFLDWLDTEGDPARPVILLGFADGAALAGALLLAEPERWAGGVLLHGELPADVPADRARLSGIPVFLAHDGDGPTHDYLVSRSGAPVRAESVPGGDRLDGRIVGEVGTWLTERLDFLRRHGENPLADGDEPGWPTVPGGRLPDRGTADGAPRRDELLARISSLEGLRPGTLTLDRSTTSGPDEAFLDPATGELARVDDVLHLALPTALAYDALAKGWAVPDPLAGVRVAAGRVRVFLPRDAAELDVVTGVAAAAHGNACTPAP
ncbi:phospholipase [Pseudonocardia sp.]|uniref:alpha/beta hydrolase n=1 Tax=Pseudonocardia sp. TaxID=60912 RepID=UPI00262D982C|nr:phospholipase [Pseudonocardia sp.]